MAGLKIDSVIYLYNMFLICLHFPAIFSFMCFDFPTIVHFPAGVLIFLHFFIFISFLTPCVFFGFLLAFSFNIAVPGFVFYSYLFFWSSGFVFWSLCFFGSFSPTLVHLGILAREQGTMIAMRNWLVYCVPHVFSVVSFQNRVFVLAFSSFCTKHHCAKSKRDAKVCVCVHRIDFSPPAWKYLTHFLSGSTVRIHLKS